MARCMLALLVLLLCILPGSVRGAPTEPNQPGPWVPHRQGPTDPQELEAFLDPFFAQQMAKLHIPGAVVLVVKDGEIFFTKGYGFANLEQRTPVLPEKTLFRVGSISKLFTATAVMQLAERGLLTLAHLLTHTGGFDDRIIGMAARSASEVVPLGSYLAARMPPRVRPSGEVISYSNHGTALAGYLVEVISGVPFAQYVDEQILQPLGMHRSSFGLPPHLARDLAVGYEYTNGAYQPVAFDYFNVAPAGSLITTATDIARFMMAHLAEGRYGNVRILNAATVQEMHRQHFTHHPRLPGFAYGFYEHFQNNRRAIKHDGGWRGFSSVLVLLPGQKLGVFVAYNTYRTSTGLFPPHELVTQFLNHYYPAPEKPVPLQPRTDMPNGFDRFTGSYRCTWYSRRTVLKLAAWSGAVRVTGSSVGALTVGSRPLVEVDPLFFQRVDADGSVAFRADPDGRITYMFTDQDCQPGGAYEKLAWYEGPDFHLFLIGFFVLIFLSAHLVWAVGSLIRRLRRRRPAAPRPARRAWGPAGLISTLNLIFLIGLDRAVFGNGWDFAYGMRPVAIAWLCLPVVATFLTPLLPILAVLIWKYRYWSVIGRCHYSLVTLAALLYIPFLLYWNLLGFRF